MNRILALCMTLVAATAVADEPLPRDPFWPQGHEGLRYPITTEPRIKPKPQTAPVTPKREVKDGRAVADAAEKAAAAKAAARQEEEERRWQHARKALSFGGIMGFRGPDGAHQTAVTINDRIYVPGDVVSANDIGARFTWKIEAVTPEGKIKLRRVKCGAIKTESKP